MSLNRLIGYGVTLGVDILNASTFVTLASIVSPPTGPGSKTEVVDITILSDKYKSKTGSQIDPGEITFEIAYDPADATTTTLATLFANSNTANWQIVYGNAATETFHGFVSGFARKMTSATERVSAEITITLSGGDLF